MSTEHDPVDLDADRLRQADDAAQAAKFLREEAEDWSWFLASARGRRIVWRLLEKTGVYRTTFAVEPHQTAFNEGGRNAGLQVLASVMQHAPEQLFAMSEEAKAQ